MSNRVNDYVARAAADVSDKFVTRLARACLRCESPIERLLMCALVVADDAQPKQLLHIMGVSELPSRAPFGDAALVYTQARIGRYRADFAIVDATGAPDGSQSRVMIVECDGHDFHEKTKKQAQHDKARDRYFQSLGHKVLHFTGSEIWADPDACAREILNHLACEDEWRARPS